MIKKYKVFFVFLSVVIYFYSLFISIKLIESNRIELFGFILGGSWMIYNIYAYLFDKTMSMRGKIDYDVKNTDLKIRRVFVVTGSLFIYFVLIFGIINYKN